MIDLLALLDHNALLELFCGKADGGSCNLFAVGQNTALHDQTACLTVGSSQTRLDHQGQDADGAIGQIRLGQLGAGSKSALGSYETEDFKDISHYALIRLAKFYGVTADYLLGLSEMKNHPNADLADLRLSDEMIDLLKSGRIDNTLLCELAAHPDFPRLMADLEIYVNGTALKQAQGANAIVDTMSATVIKKHNPGMSDTQLRQLITAHIDEDEFCRYVIQRDINGIALALRETHKDDFFSVPEDNPLKEMLETAGEIVSQDSDTEQAYLAFICKRLKLNFRKLSVEERKWLKKIAEKSDLLKNPKPQRGRR